MNPSAEVVAMAAEPASDFLFQGRSLFYVRVGNNLSRGCRDQLSSSLCRFDA